MPSHESHPKKDFNWYIIETNQFSVTIVHWKLLYAIFAAILSRGGLIRSHNTDDNTWDYIKHTLNRIATAKGHVIDK